MARRRDLTLVAIAAIAVTLFAWTRPVRAAKKKIAVHGFAGPGGSRVRAGFIRGVRRRVKVVSARACARGGCHATVKGRVSKRGRRYRVVVTVLNGADGEVIGRRAASARSRRRLTSTGISLGRSCLRLIAKGASSDGAVAASPPAPAPAPPPEPPPAATPPPGSAQPPPPVEDELFTTQRRRTAAEKEGALEEGEEGRVEKRHKRRWTGLLDVSAAIGLATRSYELAGASASDNSTYEGGMYPEFTVRLDLFPAAPFTTGFMRNLGLSVAYSRHISISTKLPTANSDVKTGSQEVLLDARLRWAFFSRPTTPILSFYGGFGLRDFDLDPNDVLTSFNYRFLRFGLEGIVPLGSPLISLYAGFDARPLLGIGQEAVEAYGVRSGGFGWAVRGGAYGKIALGVFYFLAFEYLAFSAEFDGREGARPNTIDRAEPTSGADRYIRLWAGAGYAL